MVNYTKDGVINRYIGSFLNNKTLPPVTQYAAALEEESRNKIIIKILVFIV